MAINGGDGSIILTTKVEMSGLKKGLAFMKSGSAKAFAAIGVAAAAASIAITKMATDAYADYEQLVGGVETLFKGSADKVKAYAENAFATTGQSANEYMKQVTSFSAALIRSTAGDTDKAADVANMAMIDMSDNANKMGTSMESIQYAYQGFAKQNYTMLDNLKLGYGGTKTEMERLLKDAQALTGVKYDITNLADVYTAIHVIQENLGIAGTTALEAEKTISGSAATMKAAWQNVLTAISGGGDLDKAINNLVDSISNYFENIVPVVERALSGIGRLIEKVAPMLVQTVAKSLIAAIPSLLSAVYEMIVGLAKGIYQGIIDLFSGNTNNALQQQAESIKDSVDNQNDLTKAVEETDKAMSKTLAGFDEIQIVSSGTSKEANIQTPMPTISGGGEISGLGFKESEKEASAFEKAFKKIADNISKTMSNVWNSEPVQVFWDSVKAIGQTGLSAFQMLGSSLWQNLKATWGNISLDFNLMTSNMSQLWTMFWQDVQVAIDTWGQPIIDGVLAVFDAIWTTAIQPLVQFMVEAWTGFTTTLKEKWEEYGQPLLERIGAFATNVINLFKSIWDKIIAPIVKPFLESLTKLWNEHIKGLIDKVVGFVLKLATSALEIYNKFIHPIVNWLINTFKPAFELAGEIIAVIFRNTFGIVADVLGSIIDVFGGIIDFITGVFTGNWKKAWDGIARVFRGIWDGIANVFKGFINLIIDGLNIMIRGINRLSFDVPDWVPGIGGQKWGFNIPQIPRLAQGAVIPPNKEFLAVLGDQKQGINIETPLSTMVEAFQKALDSRQNSTTKEEHYYLNETELMSVVYKLFKGGERLQGESLASGGTY